MNNYAAKKANGEFILFLNDDTKIIDSNWLTEMVSICSQNDVGVVGAKLLHLDNTIQHAGITFLKNGFGFHPFLGMPNAKSGYFGFPHYIKDCSAITGACLLIKKDLFKQIGMFDENFDLYYGDADLCLRVREMGFRVVYTPYAYLIHDGSHSIQGHSQQFFDIENYYYFANKWPKLKNGDPYYNPNLAMNYSIDN